MTVDVVLLRSFAVEDYNGDIWSYEYVPAIKEVIYRISCLDQIWSLGNAETFEDAHKILKANFDVETSDTLNKLISINGKNVVIGLNSKDVE